MASDPGCGGEPIAASPPGPPTSGNQEARPLLVLCCPLLLLFRSCWSGGGSGGPGPSTPVLQPPATASVCQRTNTRSEKAL